MPVFPGPSALLYIFTPESGANGSILASFSEGVTDNSSTSFILTTPVPGAPITKSLSLSVVTISPFLNSKLLNSALFP